MKLEESKRQITRKKETWEKKNKKQGEERNRRNRRRKGRNKERGGDRECKNIVGLSTTLHAISTLLCAENRTSRPSS
jgi:hypothetical protein